MFGEEAVFSPKYIFGNFVKNQLTVEAWVYLWVFYSIPLVYVFVYILLPYCFCYYKTLKYNLKSGVVIPPVLFFFFLRIDLAIQGLLCFHINFMIVFSSSVKDVIGIFMEIALNL
jgi:hypothetical protein